MSKKITDLNEEDVSNQPVWYFPMDESIEDGDLIVEPLLELTMPADNYQMIVKSTFTDSNQVKYMGYIYWAREGSITSWHPCVFLQGEPLYFWYGLGTPSHKDINLLKKIALPITFESFDVLNLDLISGEIEGLYSYNENFEINVLK